MLPKDEILAALKGPVDRTVGKGLKVFKLTGTKLEVVEQNPEKPSEWGRLARDGHVVYQIKDGHGNNLGVVVDGIVQEYRGSSDKIVSDELK